MWLFKIHASILVQALQGGGDEIKRLLDTKSDELKPVYFDGMMEKCLIAIGSRSSLCCRSVIFWSGSADPNH